ncbi:hypothetical protein HDV05_005642, partial [Chytridiales sp. JEL 0842]
AIGRKINLVLGDTKERIARRTGRKVEEINEEEASAVVIHGERIPYLTEDDWDTIFRKEEIIFARTSPKDKLDIVKRAQALGHIVGVTGDGVNDSPALKKADLGIAMNNSGSDVSKEAATMILLDDNFASIVRGITEGRLIFTNLKKSVQYAVTHIIPEVLPYLLYVILPIPLAITAIQILVVDLGFELLASLSFAWEKPETLEGLMTLLPRKPVTEESIALIRRKQANRERAGLERPTLPRVPKDDGSINEVVEEVDEEEWELPSRFRMYMHELQMMTTKQYWVDLIWSHEGEILVDMELLMWSYVEGGLIECVGALVAFFAVLYFSFGVDLATAMRVQKVKGYWLPHSPNMTLNNGAILTGPEQWEAIRQAQSAFYLSVLVIQMWNLFACKARFRPPWGWFMVENRNTWVSLFSGTLFGAVIVYTPFMNVLFGTSMNLDVRYLCIPMIFGFVLLLYRTGRFYIVRQFYPERYNQPIENLNMHPSKYSLAPSTEV